MKKTHSTLMNQKKQQRYRYALQTKNRPSVFVIGKSGKKRAKLVAMNETERRGHVWPRYVKKHSLSHVNRRLVPIVRAVFFSELLFCFCRYTTTCN